MPVLENDNEWHCHPARLWCDPLAWEKPESSCQPCLFLLLHCSLILRSLPTVHRSESRHIKKLLSLGFANRDHGSLSLRTAAHLRSDTASLISFPPSHPPESIAVELTCESGRECHLAFHVIPNANPIYAVPRRLCSHPARSVVTLYHTLRRKRKAIAVGHQLLFRSSDDQDTSGRSVVRPDAPYPCFLRDLYHPTSAEKAHELHTA